MMTDKTKKPLDTLKDRLRDALFGNGKTLLAEFLPKVGDDEVIHTIDSLSPKQKLIVFRALQPKRKVKILLDLSDYSFQMLLPRLTFDEIWELISKAQSDDAVDIIQWLDGPRHKKVVDRLKESDPDGILPLLVFDEHTAGGRMKTEILKYRQDRTVDDIRQEVVKDPKARSKSHYIYITDENDELIGRFSPIRLIQASGEGSLIEILDPTVVSLPADMDQEEAALVFDEEGAIELPVVNRKGKLLGVITADDIFAVMEEEHSEDVIRLAGVHEDANISDPIWLSARRRIPWLAVNMVTALLAASVIGLFRGTIEQIVILAAFMPIIAGMGGNAGQQSLAIAVRAMALGEFQHLRTYKVIMKEVAVGSLNGFLAGVIVGIVASVFTGNAGIGAVIVMAMTMNLFAAGLVGVAIPLSMRAMKTDPALASTVFVSAVTDIFGFFVFLGLATVLLV
ncbi:MAG: magnesium transporter [Patescibacteria group bacterium]|nr:magnesium transporter [Patescibacteria group bacterium]